MLWLDGKIQEDARASFDLRDRGLLLGDGLFETFVAWNGRAFMLDAHLDRLLAGAAALQMPIERELLRPPVDALAAALPSGGVIRLTVTRGTGPRGLRLPAHQTPVVFATASAPWRPALELPQVRLATTSIRRNASSPLSRHKTLAYLDNVLALQEALERGADDALLLTTQGRVACASAANLFLIHGRNLLTPPLEDGVLAGITRGLVLQQIAPMCGLNPREASLSREALFKADAVFLTNSVALVTEVIDVDGVPLARHARALVEHVCSTLATLVRDQ
ncbi:aminotransferase class IV [Microvirga massiliensis]|uniref:aminotransferase class IV n=1 Tax=Microvirga massiliensis TaxID=1033741 RepID=UPI00062BD49F|nr:aminotransferase class IV [Microvirga massiliensis]